MNLFDYKTSKKPKEVFAALDIGSSKICCAIGTINRDIGADSNRSIKILGVSSHVSKGIRGSTIVNIEELEDSILNAVHTAEQIAQQNIKSVYVNIPSDSLQSVYFTSRISLNGQAVEEHHLEKALSDVSKSNVYEGRRVIHCFPMWYDLDENTHIQDPRHMIGNTLITHFHIITAPINLIANLSTCIGRCHLDVDAFIAGSYASSLATIVAGEKEMGVTLIDMGGHSISIISYHYGMPIFLASIPLGGAYITSDIAQGLNTTISQAERLKILYGSLIGGINNQETILITQLGDDSTSFAQPIAKGLLAHIIQARAEEIIEYIQSLLKNSKVDSLATQRFVLTGGAGQLQGLKELMQNNLNKPVRFAIPQGIYGMGDILHTSTFSVCAGILHYAMQDYQGLKLYGALERPKNIFKKAWSWVSRNV